MRRNIVPPPVYFVLFAILAVAIDRELPFARCCDDMPPATTTFRYLLAVSLCLAGLVLDLRSLYLFFVARTSFNPIQLHKTQQLVTTGVYRFTRNPMYLGLVFLLLALVIFLGNLVSVVLLPLFIVLLTVVQIKPEEQLLAAKFGEQYAAYLLRVRRWL